ncbi:negative regulator of flagellin synthesis [Gracilibacillus boraciitolerans JCM 21714]|uniref:Negative regulator of flagellin synthesis n=1 Tax=Gracilibacillus boraciitolerans JCM 21714 TaxID=1298598 RepID=W4VPH7_9BACI|nr:flagellar biosynthesis anti-sigma factor FlgM [Gracilibacillus boraciitolerans]GAE95066.1 negative regulator of flagellin synthesis [Gracilibacillus boraciitolerans JCM 21714]
MKINGPNQSNFNAYKNQTQLPNKEAKTSHTFKPDQLEISDKALKMQQKDARQAYVNEIKQQVDNGGEYKVNEQETAKKILNFWKA